MSLVEFFRDFPQQTVNCNLMEMRVMIITQIYDISYKQMSQDMIIERVLEGMAMFFASVSFLASLTTLILIFIRIRPLTSNVPILLICNTYIAVIGYSFMILLVMSYGVYANLHPTVSFDDYGCQLRCYFSFVFLCAIYYSCTVQAAFRLFRIVFPKYKILQSRGVFTVVIIVQWLISVLSMLVYFLLGDFQYHPEIGSCWVSFKNIRALLTGATFFYGVPLATMNGIYVCIIRYVRRSVQTQLIRQQANKRDLLVVRRMLLLVFIATGTGMPALCICIIYFITNYLSPLAYHIQVLGVTAGFAIKSIVLGLISPQVREIFRKNRRILPAVITVPKVAERGMKKVDNII